MPGGLTRHSWERSASRGGCSRPAKASRLRTPSATATSTALTRRPPRTYAALRTLTGDLPVLEGPSRARLQGSLLIRSGCRAVPLGQRQAGTAGARVRLFGLVRLTVARRRSAACPGPSARTALPTPRPSQPSPADVAVGVAVERPWVGEGQAGGGEASVNAVEVVGCVERCAGQVALAEGCLDSPALGCDRAQLLLVGAGGLGRRRGGRVLGWEAWVIRRRRASWVGRGARRRPASRLSTGALSEQRRDALEAIDPSWCPAWPSPGSAATAGAAL